MAEYRQIEYRIGKDGKVTETVLNSTGASCTETTAGIENALGDVESQNLLPEYYQGEENVTIEESQSLTQM